MNVVEIIKAKRDGERLTDAQLRWFIDAYTKGEIADEQAAALCMAIYFQGMQPGELAVWTGAMIDSGERLDLSSVGRPTVDKHSTGGVGDKVSLILAPLVAACGAAVPQLSGRGLGHSGGTLDKLDAIAGWRSGLSPTEMVSQLQTVGCVIAAAGSGLTPADRKLYALRDVTATVESIPLIASSIMSKKIAEGTEALVLDVKTGSGAFMRSRDDATRLAEAMVVIGEANGVRTSALITAMDTVLGRAAGNAIEVTESVDVLAGRVDGLDDLVEVTLALADEMISLAGISADPGAHLADGSALGKWREMVTAQGGDPDAPLPEASQRLAIRAERAGYITRLDALSVGIAAWRLGAGRSRKEDPVSATAGVICVAKEGDAVEEGQPILELHVDDAGTGPRRGRGSRRRDRHRLRASRAQVPRPRHHPKLTVCSLEYARAHPSEQTVRMPAPVTLDAVRAAPKVLLHDHLDGGLRPSTIVELADEIGYRDLPATDLHELAAWFTRGADTRDILQYLATFEHTLAVMQTEPALHRVAREAALDLAVDGVVYAEVRFAPELHQERGLSLDEVVDAVQAGFRDGEHAAAAVGQTDRDAHDHLRDAHRVAVSRDRRAVRAPPHAVTTRSSRSTSPAPRRGSRRATIARRSRSRGAGWPISRSMRASRPGSS